MEVTYRSGSEPGRPPDIQVIQKKMAIVAWQPGPNRVVAVPAEVRLRAGLKVGGPDRKQEPMAAGYDLS